MSGMNTHVRAFFGCMIFSSIFFVSDIHARAYFFYSSADPWIFVRGGSDGTNSQFVSAASDNKIKTISTSDTSLGEICRNE